jgi:hypothetical protein
MTEYGSIIFPRSDMIHYDVSRTIEDDVTEKGAVCGSQEYWSASY